MKDATAVQRMRRYRARLRGEDVPHHKPGRPKKSAASPPKQPKAAGAKKGQFRQHVTPPEPPLSRKEAGPIKVRDLLELSTKAIAWRLAVMRVATAPHPAPEDYVHCVEAVRAGVGQQRLTPDKADNLLRIVADLDVLIPRLTAYREVLARYEKS